MAGLDAQRSYIYAAAAYQNITIYTDTLWIYIYLLESWFHSKIFIFGQDMAKNGAHAHIWVHTFFGHNSAIFRPIDSKFLREIRILLSIDWWWEIQFMMLIFQSLFMGHFWRENGCGHHACPLWFKASKPDQKVGPLDGPFGSTAISKLCCRNFQCWLVNPRPPL